MIFLISYTFLIKFFHSSPLKVIKFLIKKKKICCQWQLSSDTAYSCGSFFCPTISLQFLLINIILFFLLLFVVFFLASIFPSAASWGNWGNHATNLYQPHSMSHVTPSHVAPHLSSYPHYA